MKRVVSFFITIVLLSGIIIIPGMNVSAADDIKTGTLVTFGSYPQTSVIDSVLLDELNSQELDWHSYGYYYVGKQEDYMEYADVMLSNGNCYRAVTFTHNRLSDVYDSLSDVSIQKWNGYKSDKVYWFKYEPLVWRVLDASTGLLMAENIIDSQPFHNELYKKEYAYYGDRSYTHYASNWEYSSLRTWLNDDFCNTAFGSEKIYIKNTSLSTPSCNESGNDLSSTTDTVFLLSMEDAMNPAYGFSSDNDNGTDTNRIAYGTDYARCQGLLVDSSTGRFYSGASWWRLRSALGDSSRTHNVRDEGFIGDDHTYLTDLGIRPALCVNLKSAISESIIKITNSSGLVINGPCETMIRNVFYEKKYMADIWLDLRNTGNETNESKLIKTLLGLDSLSTSIYENLDNNAWFMKSVAVWKGFDAIFDTASATKDYTFGMTELYESIIFDLLEQAMEKDNTQNVILDAVETIGDGSKAVSKAKKSVDEIVGTLESYSGTVFDFKAVTAGKAGVNVDKIVKLAGMQNACKKYTENKVLGYLNTFLKVSESVADFFQMVISFQMAVDMCDEMKTLLTIMRANTDDTYLQVALNNVITAVDNADWASFVITTRFAENTSVNIAKKLIDHVWKSNAYAAMLKLGYDVGHTVSNMLTNTDGIIDAYYECKAMTSFVESNEKAIGYLADTYKAQKDETSAGAYIYAMRMYEHVYLLDFDATLNFVKKGTEEGLVNLSTKFSKTMADYIFHTEHENTYDAMLEDRESIADSMRSHFEFLMNAWKFNKNYLKNDYPDIYPIYVTKEISKDVYTPKILSAILNEDGDSEIIYSLDGYYIDEETKEAHILYGANSLTGVETTETIGQKETSFVSDYTYEKNKVTFSTRQLLDSFPKKYTARAFSETSVKKTYTQTSKEKQIKDPCTAVRLVAAPGDKGIGIGILDQTPVRYQNKIYRIYRKTKSSDYAEIGVTKRASLHIIGGCVAGMIDETAQDGIEYTYKVISEMTFSDGTTLRSPESNEFTITNKTSQSGELTVVLNDNRNKSQTIIRKVSARLSARNPVNEDNSGIEISWNAVEGVSGYEVYRKPTFGTKYTLIKILDESVTTCTDTNLEYGVEYDYCVVTYTGKETDDKAYISSSYGKTSTVAPDYITGDVDGNGQILANDARLALRCSAKLETLTEIQMKAADVDGNNQVLADDARQILRYSAKLQTEFIKAKKT